MNRRIVIAVAAIAMLAIPATSLATRTAVRTGSFDTMGTGTLVAQGSLRAFGTIEGTVIVRDRVGGAIVKIGGVRQKPRLVELGDRTIRVYILKKVSDSFYAKGDNIRIELRAPDSSMSMSALGRGRIMRLDGEGTYHLNGGDEQPWSSALLPLAIAPLPPELPTPPGGQPPAKPTGVAA